MAEKGKKEFYRKWWFWVIVLVCVIVVSSSSVIIVALLEVTSDVSGIAIKIQDIYNGATLYTSAGERELILKINNFQDIKDTTKYSEMIELIKRNKDSTFENYEKLIVFSYLDDEEKQLIISVYNMTNFTTIKENSYIKFEEYEKLYNTLDKTMDSYTDLFKSIY